MQLLNVLMLLSQTPSHKSLANSFLPMWWATVVSTESLLLVFEKSPPVAALRLVPNLQLQQDCADNSPGGSFFGMVVFRETSFDMFFFFRQPTDSQSEARFWHSARWFVHFFVGNSSSSGSFFLFAGLGGGAVGGRGGGASGWTLSFTVQRGRVREA